MRRGIMIFDRAEQDWKIWIGQQAYQTLLGMTIEIRITNHYYETCLMQDDTDWIVTLDYDVTFILRTTEVYKVRLFGGDLIPEMDLPF